MEDVTPFFQFLYKFVTLTPDDFRHYIKPYIVVRQFDKKVCLTKAGEVEQYFYFILQGTVRKYYKKEGEQFNVQISTEGHIIHAQESFYSRTPSEYYIETLEPSRFICITFENLEHIFSANAKMERLGRLLITFNMILRHRWQMQLIKLAPRERFLYFVHNYPELIQRVPQKMLASYLNIQPETFSRFKHLIRQHKVTKA